MSKKKVLAKLVQDHIGRSNAISHGNLAEALGVSKSTVADLVQDLRDSQEIPLGTAKGANSGTFVIADKEELQDQIGRWNQEKQRIVSRIENTTEAFAEFDHNENVEVEEEPQVVEQTYDCSVEGCNNSMTRDNTFWPKDGDLEGQTVCKSCYGGLVMKGQA